MYKLRNNPSNFLMSPSIPMHFKVIRSENQRAILLGGQTVLVIEIVLPDPTTPKHSVVLSPYAIKSPYWSGQDSDLHINAIHLLGKSVEKPHIQSSQRSLPSLTKPTEFFHINIQHITQQISFKRVTKPRVPTQTI